MRKLSEVCKLVGVTRRTLQEYANPKVDLLQPTRKTEAGYWMYDDAAVQRLVLIQIFVEAGYERKKIKAILDSDDFDLELEFEKITDILKAKRKQIDGMINTMETIKMSFKLPLSSVEALSKMDFTRIYKEKSFVDCFEESVAHTAEYTEQDKEDASKYLPMWYLVTAIGCLKDSPADSEEVQSCVLNFLENIIQLGMFEEEDMTDENGNPYPQEVMVYVAALAMEEAIDDMMSDTEVKNMIEIQCGDGAQEFIKLAFHAYSLSHEYLEEKYDLS